MVFSYWFVLSYKNIKKIFTFWHTCLLFILKNACYSETKYYLCKQNNKRSLLGRKQRSRVARSFPNRYLFGLCDKVTSLFSTSCILDIILHCKNPLFASQEGGTTLVFVVVLLLFSPLIITYVHQFSCCKHIVYHYNSKCNYCENCGRFLEFHIPQRHKSHNQT